MLHPGRRSRSEGSVSRRWRLTLLPHPVLVRAAVCVVRSEVLQRASEKLLHRMGYQATTGTQTNEGHGFGARGLPGEAAGATVDFRLADDQGKYHRVGELGPNSSEAELNATYTLREVVGKARAGGVSAPVGIGERGLV